jgi:hypothetical protein
MTAKMVASNASNRLSFGRMTDNAGGNHWVPVAGRAGRCRFTEHLPTWREVSPAFRKECRSLASTTATRQAAPPWQKCPRWSRSTVFASHRASQPCYDRPSTTTPYQIHQGCIPRYPSLDTMHVPENCGPVMQPAEKLNASALEAAMESSRSNSGEQAMKSRHLVLLHQMQRMGLNS